MNILFWNLVSGNIVATSERGSLAAPSTSTSCAYPKCIYQKQNFNSLRANMYQLGPAHRHLYGNIMIAFFFVEYFARKNPAVYSHLIYLAPIANHQRHRVVKVKNNNSRS